MCVVVYVTGIKNSKHSDRDIWANSACPVQSVPEGVWIVSISFAFFRVHPCCVWPICSLYRTTVVSKVSKLL